MMRRDAFNIVSREWDDPWQQNRVLLNGACWDMRDTCQRTPPQGQGRQIQSKTRKTWADSRWGRQVIEITIDEMTVSRDIADVSIVLPSYCRPSPICPKACRTKRGQSKNHHMTINTWIQHRQSSHVNLFSRRDLLLKPDRATHRSESEIPSMLLTSVFITNMCQTLL